MTHHQRRQCLTQLRWSGRSLAAIFPYDERTIRRWMTGEATPPEPVDAWLETLANFHAANPPPAILRD